MSTNNLVNQRVVSKGHRKGGKASTNDFMNQCVVRANSMQSVRASELVYSSTDGKLKMSHKGNPLRLNLWVSADVPAEDPNTGVKCLRLFTAKTKPKNCLNPEDWYSKGCQVKATLSPGDVAIHSFGLKTMASVMTSIASAYEPANAPVEDE